LRTVGRSESLLGVTTALERQFAHHVLGLPPPEPLFTTWTDLTITGFRCAAGQAVAWWLRLRAAHQAVRRWPVLLDPDAPSYFTQRGADAVVTTTYDGPDALCPARDHNHPSWVMRRRA
jgi:hypothetical protein